ncbi:tetraspanin [Thermoascus aurantiacus ATCC 26904]
MANNILLTYLVADFAFLIGGILLLVGSLVMNEKINGPKTVDNAPQVLLLSMFPTKAAIVNAIFIFVTFALSLPGVVMSDNRFFLKIHGYLVVVCATFTLVLGLRVWFDTLKTRANLSTLWGQQPPEVQSLLQQRFDCCGYINSTFPPFQQDSVCTTPLVAAQKQGCVGPFATFANIFLDFIFTADFGIVGIDTILLLCTAVVLKDRKERERYRLIDAKNGLQGF